MVGAVGIEPTTSAVSRRRSPAELSTPAVILMTDTNGETSNGA